MSSEARYEICRIRSIYRSQRGSLFRPGISITQIIAERITPDGIVVIAQSDEFRRLHRRNFKKEDFASLEQADSQIMSQILADGWEPFGHDQIGNIWFKRRVKGTSPSQEPVVDSLLLTYLIALRDLDILTQAEFDKKLPELMKHCKP